MQAIFIQTVPTANYTERIKSVRMMNRIRELREERHMTLEQLSERMSCSLPQLQKMETGERRLNDKWIRILTNIFGCTPGELYNEPSHIGFYKVNDELMKEASIAIASSAATNKTKLSIPEAVAFTVELYNHAMEYRAKGKAAEINESMAALILRQRSRQ